MIIGISSGKGGTGKTLLASSLSYLYSKQNKKVLLLDLDFGESNTYLVFENIFPKYTLYDFLYHNFEWDKLKTKINPNLDFVMAGCGVDEIANINSHKENMMKLKQQIQQDVKNYDIILLETGAGCDNKVTEFLLICDKILIVMGIGMHEFIGAASLIKNLCVSKNISDKIKMYGVFNQERTRADRKDIKSYEINITNLCKSKYHKNIKMLGSIPYSEKIRKLAKNRRLFMKYFYKKKETKPIKNVGEILCQKATMINKKTNQ
jgi:flagellar biosynthesis protein FlhG